MKKILITGINGFLGSHLAIELQKEFQILGLEYSSENLHRVKEYDFKIYSIQNNTLESIFEENDIHAILHVATIYRKENNSILDLLNTNVILPVRLLELAIKNNVDVFLNTDSFFNNNSYSYSYLSDYTLTKKHSLEWIKLQSESIETSCKIVNMKVFHMFGESDNPNKFIPFVMRNIKSNKDVLNLTLGKQTRDFIYVKDVVLAFKHVINKFKDLNNFQELEVGTGQSHSIEQLVTIIKEITNSLTELNFGGLPYREGEIMESKVENYRLRDIGWAPKYTLKEALKEYIRNE